jgi:hypothetical protein
MGLDRRQFAAAGLALAGGAMSAAAADPLSGAALYADVQAYAALGPHRTGTAGDAATTAWMLRALDAAGYRTATQGFDYPVFALEAAELILGERRIAGFPVWTPKAGDVAGALGREIAVVRFPYGTGAGLGAATYRAPIEAAIHAGAAAVVVVVDHPLGELAALNAEPNVAPWPVPVLQVAGREAQALASGSPARVRIAGASHVAGAENVVARRPGPGRALVISTPKSGWMTCSGERGSGVAIWLALARWLAAQPQHDVTLVAASGHEVDGYGGHLFAEHQAPAPAETKLWLHIGANVACYDFALSDGVITRLPGPPKQRLLACSEVLLPVARAAFAGQPGYATPTDIDVQPAPGEVAYYQKLGYRPIVGVVGSHPLHHTARDLPDATGPAMLEPVARALSAIVSGLPA